MATIGKTLFAHFREVLHASAQYDQAMTVFHRLKKRLEVSNLCSLSWDQTVTFSDLAHGLRRHRSQAWQLSVWSNKKAFLWCVLLWNARSNAWKTFCTILIWEPWLFYRMGGHDYCVAACCTSRRSERHIFKQDCRKSKPILVGLRSCSWEVWDITSRKGRERKKKQKKNQE